MINILPCFCISYFLITVRSSGDVLCGSVSFSLTMIVPGTNEGCFLPSITWGVPRSDGVSEFSVGAGTAWALAEKPARQTNAAAAARRESRRARADDPPTWSRSRCRISAPPRRISNLCLPLRPFADQAFTAVVSGTDSSQPFAQVKKPPEI